MQKHIDKDLRKVVDRVPSEANIRKTWLRLAQRNLYQLFSLDYISLNEKKIISSCKEFVLDYITNIKENISYKHVFGPPAAMLVKEVNLENKTCLITGASGDIGLEITRCLSHHNCKVLMACRNIYKAKLAVAKAFENQHLLEYYQVDLASLASVKRCADRLLANEKKIDIIILNAATFGLPWTLTEDRIETIFQVNFLSQYYLLLCLGRILASDARIVFTSSESHRNFKWTSSMAMLENFSLSKAEYTSIKSYNISKLCGIWFMHLLSYQWVNTKKSVFCAHPGSFIKTGLCRNWWAYEALYTLMLPFSKTVMQGAGTIVYCATSPELEGLTAEYFKNCKRCNESDIARDVKMAFKIHNVILDILRDRVVDFEELIKNFNDVK